MHPVVIMSYDKSPAITKAVAALEEAGMEVVVLNTKTAKLVQFLGALAGEDDEDVPTPAEPPAEEPVEKPTAKEPPPEESDDLEPLKTEAIVNDEKVLIEYVEGASIALHPSAVGVGQENAKSTYALNESQFSFWSKKDAEALTTKVMLELNGSLKYVDVVLSRETSTPPRLKIGRDWKE